MPCASTGGAGNAFSPPCSRCWATAAAFPCVTMDIPPLSQPPLQRRDVPPPVQAPEGRQNHPLSRGWGECGTVRRQGEMMAAARTPPHCLFPRLHCTALKSGNMYRAGQKNSDEASNAGARCAAACSLLPQQRWLTLLWRRRCSRRRLGRGVCCGFACGRRFLGCQLCAVLCGCR